MESHSQRSGKGSFQNPFPSIQERKANVGTAGRRIKLQTNHFGMKISDKPIFRYSVDFKMPWKRDIRRKDEPILIRAVEAMKAQKVISDIQM